MGGAAGGKKSVGFAKSRRFVTLADARCVFHMISFFFFVAVWVFHFSEQARELKGSAEFGWFFRYLTFCSFTLQTWQLFLSTLADLSKKATKYKVKRDADDFGCMAFATSNTVTLMYYSLYVITGGKIDEGKKVIWLSVTTHILNSAVAWLDVFLSYPRRFSSRSRVWTGIFAACYCSWICFIRHETGYFPYPFLNSLPHPQGIILVALVGCAVMLGFSFLGNLISGLGRKRLEGWEEADPVWELEGKVKNAKAQRLAERPKELFEELKAD